MEKSWVAKVAVALPAGAEDAVRRAVIRQAVTERAGLRIFD